MNSKSIFIFTTSFLIHPCVLFSRQNIPGINYISADKDSDVSPLCWFLFICASLQTWCPSLEKDCGLNEGPPNYGPNSWAYFLRHKCGCKLSWIRGVSKMVWTWWEAVTAEPFTTAWVMRHQPRSSVYNLETARVRLSPGTSQADLHVPTKGGGKWKLPLKLLGIAQKNKWTKELLAEFNTNYAFLLNAGGCLV